MNTKRFAIVIAAVFAVIYFPAGKVSAQAEDGNRYSTAIDMVVRSDVTGTSQRTSHFGIMDSVGLRPNEQIAITLNASSSKANYPVGIAPLDGGEVFAPENVHVASNGTVAFTFKGGDTPGLYRVVASIGSERYQLQLYVAKPGDIGPDCASPP